MIISQDVSSYIDLNLLGHSVGTSLKEILYQYAFVATFLSGSEVNN